MSKGDVRFTNPQSGETLVHYERHGVRNLLFGPTGSKNHGHAELRHNGTPVRIRDVTGRKVC